MRLFIDTWGWLALRDKRESRHPEVNKFYRDFRRRRGTAYTSDYVLDETVTLLFRRLPFSAAKQSLESIQQAVTDEYLYLEWVTPERFEKAKDMVIMSECRITEILTEDDHFLQIGMGLKKAP